MTIVSETKKERYSYVFWLMMDAFYVLFAVRYVLHVNFPAIVFLAWVTVMSFVFDKDEIIALVISFFPLYPGFQYKYAILICTVVLLLKCFRKIRINAIVYFVAALMMWELLHLIGDSGSFSEYLRGFAELIFLSVVLCVPTTEKRDLSYLNRLLALSTVVAFFLLMVTTLEVNKISLWELMQKGFRFGATGAVEGEFRFNYNANGFGLICNMGITAILINIFLKKAWLIDYVMLFVITFAGCLTVSRTFLLCLALTLVLYIVLQKKSLLYKIIPLVAMAIFCLVFFLIVKEYFPSIIENYGNRFDVDDVSNGRVDLLAYYNKLLFSSARALFFGLGMQDIPQHAFEILGGTELMLEPHNGYQEILVVWGIPGFVLVALILWCIIGKSVKEKKKVPLIFYLPLILLAVNIMAGQFVTSGLKMMSLIFIYEVLANSYGASKDNQI